MRCIRHQGNDADVPGKLTIFRDEGHFITEPANQPLWYGEVLDRFDHYVNH